MKRKVGPLATTSVMRSSEAGLFAAVAPPQLAAMQAACADLHRTEIPVVDRSAPNSDFVRHSKLAAARVLAALQPAGAGASIIGFRASRRTWIRL